MAESKPEIPFNKPFIVGKELFYISQAVLNGQLAGDGRFTKKCQEWMESKFEAKKVMLTHSCTAALEMSAMLCDFKPGDEVIMPSFTFVSTANAFLLAGAKIRFIDIHPDNLNMNETQLEEMINIRTKAIVPVHYAGVACAMNEILEIAKRYNLIVVEDAAQAVNSTYKGKYLGTIGDLGTYSFHETKNFISGEGGALVVNDDRYIERAEIIREKGTNRNKFFRGQVDKYTWVDIGSSYLPSEMIAAFLFAQLEEAETITQKRRVLFDYYASELKPLQERGLIQLPPSSACCVHNAHLFYFLALTGNGDRDKLIKHLKRENIHSVFHYIPLHSSPMGKKMGYDHGSLPVTEESSKRLIRLPCYFEMTKDEQERVISAIFDFYNKF